MAQQRLKEGLRSDIDKARDKDTRRTCVTIGRLPVGSQGAEADMALQEHDDSSLVRRYLDRNDREALGELFERYSGMAYRAAVRVMNNPAEAQDGVQMAFVEIMRDLGKYKGDCSLGVWMMRVVVNTCRDMIRKASRRRQREETFMIEEERETAGEGSHTGELAEMVKRALDRLPEHYRLPVWLHHYEGMPFEEVALALSVPENTVRSHASRGIAALREQLAEGGLSVSVGGIVAAMPQVAGEAVPAALQENIGKIAHEIGEFSRAAAGPRGWLGHGAGGKLAAAVGAIVVSAGIVGGVWLANSRGARKPAAPPAATSSEKVYAQWDFNSGVPPREIAVGPASSWRFVPGGGPDGSGCMQVETDLFSARIDLRPDSLPILISYDEAILLPQNWNSGYASTISWERYKSAVLFQNICKSRVQSLPAGKEHGEWSTLRIYVTDRWVGTWEFGRITSLILFERQPDCPLDWAMRGRWRVDNMVIRTVMADEVPDVGVYLDAVEKIPVSQRKGTVAVPGLKGVADPAKPVMATFYPGSSDLRKGTPSDPAP